MSRRFDVMPKGTGNGHCDLQLTHWPFCFVRVKPKREPKASHCFEPSHPQKAKE